MGVDAAPAADSHLVYLLTDSLDGAQPPVARSELFARDPAGRKDGDACSHYLLMRSYHFSDWMHVCHL
jgi:hypothetical protein